MAETRDTVVFERMARPSAHRVAAEVLFEPIDCTRILQSKIPASEVCVE